MQEVKVSVYCLAYNHSKYIRDTLEGFVNQKTNFKYEVWVHDDASTDNTAMIIEEYARKYPTIIKPIIQKENQHSKGIGITPTYIYPRIQGKYIAICEGDDYWCNTQKLQMQVDFLEKHKEYSACVHNTKVVNCMSGAMSRFNASKHDMDLSVEDILPSGSSQFHTSSIVYRTRYMNRPDAFRAKGFGDYPLAIYLATEGKIRYLKEVMSVYRLFTEGSWSRRTYLDKNHADIEIKHHTEVIRMLSNIDEYTKGKYSCTIKKVQNRHEFNIVVLQKGYKKAIAEERALWDKQLFSVKVKTLVRAYCSVLAKQMKKAVLQRK